MYLLKDEQIGLIAKDVENEGINFSHLKAELIDHICCGIESYMNDGVSFYEAYSQVKKEFGIKGLRRIQQDTLMLIDKNYRIMKNSMKTIGVLALGLMAFAALFKIMHWPFAGPMLVLSFFLITCLFFPALLYVMYRDVNKKQQALLYITAFVCGILFMSGVLFKIMHWPGAQLLFFPGLALIAYLLIPLIILLRINKLKTNKTVFLLGLISLMIVLTGMIFKVNHWSGAGILLPAGSAFLILVFVPVYYVLDVRKSEKLRVDFIFAIVALTYFIVFSFLLALTGNPDLLMEQNFQAKSYKANALFLANNSQNLLKDTTIAKAFQLTSQADIIDKELEEIKILIMQTNFSVNKEEAALLLKNNSYIGGSNNDVNYLLPEYNANSPLPELKKDIDEFNEIYTLLLKDSLQENVQVNQLFNTEKRFDKRLNQQISWEDDCFMNCPATEALKTLSLWQYNIRLAENKVLSKLVYNLKIN